MLISLHDKGPQVEPGCFVAPSATLIGDVRIGAGTGIWYGAVVRADINRITIGLRTNIQDLCVVHVERSHALTIGDEVTVGHRAIIHGCTIGNRVLIGMGAIVMNGAVIGDECIVGAGAVVTEGVVIPPRSLVLGVPGKVRREVTAEELLQIESSARHYAENAAAYLAQGLSCSIPTSNGS